MTPAERAAREAECDARFAAAPSSNDPRFWHGLQLRNDLDDNDPREDH